MSKGKMAVKARKLKDSKLQSTIRYVRQHWLLYVLFIMPAFILTIVFKYIPMGGIAIAFVDYNPFKGIAGSTFVVSSTFHVFVIT